MSDDRVWQIEPLPTMSVKQPRFRCKRGHEQEGEFSARSHAPDGRLEYQSGPVCRICYLKRQIEDCETERVE